MANNFILHINPLGKPPKYKNAKELWDKFLEYCAWADGNPIELPERMAFFGSKKSVERQAQNKARAQRPYTLYGFLAWAGIANWTEFKRPEFRKHADYLRVINAIENSIKAMQVDGAMVGVYNSNLTARLNGITEKTEVTGADGAALFKPIKVVFEGEVKPNLNPNADPRGEHKDEGEGE